MVAIFIVTEVTLSASSAIAMMAFYGHVLTVQPE